MLEKTLRPYSDIWDTKKSLERKNVILRAHDDARDAHQRVVGFMVCEAEPALREKDSKALRTWFRNKTIMFADDSYLPALSNLMEHHDIVKAFWSIVSPTFVNVCQPFDMLYRSYIDFCDVCGRKKRLSRRQFVGVISDIARNDWIVPTDSDGSLSRLNTKQWMLGREPYIIDLLARCEGRVDNPEWEEIMNWLPPICNPSRNAGGAMYLRSVYCFCRERNTGPRMEIEARYGKDCPVSEPDFEALHFWEHTKASEKYWEEYQEWLADAQWKLVALAKRTCRGRYEYREEDRSTAPGDDD
jgi:hypothetical protein